MKASPQVSSGLRSVALVWFTVRSWGVDWILLRLNIFVFGAPFILVLASRASRTTVTWVGIWTLVVVVALVDLYIRPIDSFGYYKSVEWDVRYESPAQKRGRLFLTFGYVGFTVITTTVAVFLLVQSGRARNMW